MEQLPNSGNSQIELDFDNKYDTFDTGEPREYEIVKTVTFTTYVQAHSEDEAEQLAWDWDEVAGTLNGKRQTATDYSVYEIEVFEDE
tara:strand:- start:540 stop:800 length:261 start_codon:yes stop_codon:yes gene_type:complete